MGLTRGCIKLGIVLMLTSLSNVVLAVVVPATMTVVWVGDEVVHNGVPMQIQSFRSKDSSAGVIAFYRSEWAKYASDDTPGFIENNIGDWSIISRIENEKNIVVQVKPGQGGMSQGFISEMDIESIPGFNQITESFPKMGGTDVISSTESNDSGIEATTIVLSNTHSVVTNAVFYKKHISRMGWKLAKSFSQNGSEILFFNGPQSKIEIAIGSAAGQTTIFANVVKG